MPGTSRQAARTAVMLAGLTSVGQARRPQPQAGVAEVLRQNFFLQNPVFLLSLSSDWMKPTHSIGIISVKSADGRH